MFDFKKSIDAYTFKPIVELWDDSQFLSVVQNDSYQRWCELTPEDRQKEIEDCVKNLT
jgi:hypothetical protein